MSLPQNLALTNYLPYFEYVNTQTFKSDCLRAARAEWGWQPRYDLAAMTADMIGTLRRKQNLA